MCEDGGSTEFNLMAFRIKKRKMNICIPAVCTVVYALKLTGATSKRIVKQRALPIIFLRVPSKRRISQYWRQVWNSSELYVTKGNLGIKEKRKNLTAFSVFTITCKLYGETNSSLPSWKEEYTVFGNHCHKRLLINSYEISSAFHFVTLLMWQNFFFCCMRKSLFPAR